MSMPLTPVSPVVDDVDEWFRCAYPRLRRFAAVVAPPTIDPDDLVQDALVRVLGHGALARLDDPVAYLCRTMTNLASDRRRRWRRGQRAHDRLGSDRSPLPSYPSDLADLGRLRPMERGAVYLHDVEGRPFDEVATLLGCTAAAARQAAVRGRDHLRTLMEVEP
jgi:RNA polymerase sigma-70 factor (ECF subfamily)